MNGNDLNVHELKPEDIFDSEYLQKYKEDHKDIYDRLIRLDTSIIILEKIAKFLFYPILYPHEMSFWHMVYWNFRDMSIIIICGLVTDKGKDTHTLTKFKNEILKNIKPEFKKSYQNKIRIAKFNDEFKKTSNKARDIRDKFIAHRLFKKNSNELTDDVGGMANSDLRKLFDKLNILFQTCSFGAGYGTRLGDFIDTTIGGKPTQSHLDDIFDLIMKYYFNEVDKNPNILMKLPEVVFESLNNYRKKFGMPLFESPS